MAKKLGSLIGSWAFLIGVVIALIAAIISVSTSYNISSAGVMITLVIIGLIVGIFNITSKESMAFLLSGTCLVVVGFFGVNVLAVIPILGNILFALLAIFVPATIIVAVRNVFSLAKN